MRLLGDALLQQGKTLLLGFHGYVVGQVGRRRARARTVDETEAVVEADIRDQVHGGFEVGVGLAGKPDDEVGAERDVRAQGTQAA